MFPPFYARRKSLAISGLRRPLAHQSRFADNGVCSGATENPGQSIAAEGSDVTRDALWDKLTGSSWQFVALGVVIVVAVWLIVRVRAWSRDGEDPAAAEHQMLSHLAELRREGNLSEEEYRSIKGRLARKIEGSVRPQSGSAPSNRPEGRRTPDAST